MCVHGRQAVYCTTELCLSVDKERCQRTEDNVYVVHILPTV